MKLDPDSCIKLLKTSTPVRLFGKVNKVVGLVAEGSGLRAPLGAASTWALASALALMSAWYL